MNDLGILGLARESEWVDGSMMATAKTRGMRKSKTVIKLYIFNIGL